MAKLPEPPSRLEVAPEMRVLRKGHRLWRVYFAGGAFPMTWSGFRHFGPTSARFDHHPDPHGLHVGAAILYAADHPDTCLAELFQRTRVIDRARHSPWLVGFRVDRDVTLLDLTSAWPTRAGASMAINTGPRPRARRWSRAIHAAYKQIEGLYYPSSMHANQPSVALFEAAQTALPAAPDFHRALADLSLLPRLTSTAARLGYRLI